MAVVKFSKWRLNSRWQPLKYEIFRLDILRITGSTTALKFNMYITVFTHLKTDKNFSRHHCKSKMAAKCPIFWPLRNYRPIWMKLGMVGLRLIKIQIEKMDLTFDPIWLPFWTVYWPIINYCWIFMKFRLQMVSRSLIKVLVSYSAFAQYGYHFYLILHLWDFCLAYKHCKTCIFLKKSNSSYIHFY